MNKYSMDDVIIASKDELDFWLPLLEKEQVEFIISLHT
jgi:hypothetical protein